MKPPLLSLAAVGPEDGFPGECFGARQRVVFYEQRIIHAIKFDSLAHGRINDFGLAQNCRRVAADVLEPVKRPDCSLGRSTLSGTRQTNVKRSQGGECCESDKSF